MKCLHLVTIQHQEQDPTKTDSNHLEKRLLSSFLRYKLNYIMVVMMFPLIFIFIIIRRPKDLDHWGLRGRDPVPVRTSSRWRISKKKHSMIFPRMILASSVTWTSLISAPLVCNLLIRSDHILSELMTIRCGLGSKENQKEEGRLWSATVLQ